MKAAISEIRRLLAGKTVDLLVADSVMRAAFERFLEILSEASRNVPPDWKDEHRKSRGDKLPISATSSAMSIIGWMSKSSGQSTRKILMAWRPQSTF